MSFPGTALVLPLHIARPKHPLLLIIKHAHIAVHTDLQRALAVAQTNLLGRRLAAQSHNIGDAQRSAPLERSGVQDRQAQTDGRDTAPRGKEVALALGTGGGVLLHVRKLGGVLAVLVVGAAAVIAGLLLPWEGHVDAGVVVEKGRASDHGRVLVLVLDGQVVRQQLELGGARGVVGHDGADAGVFAGEELVPELILVGLLADGRAALVAGVAVFDEVGGQAEVVEAGLGGDVDAVGAGFAEHGDGGGGGEVDDVQV